MSACTPTCVLIVLALPSYRLPSGTLLQGTWLLILLARHHASAAFLPIFAALLWNFRRIPFLQNDLIL
jgi:hypothetical protein